MASVSSVSSISTANQNAWQQLALQQAQRKADQAEQTAQSLKTQANEAQRAADQEQENARSLSAQSDQAQDKAGQLRQSVNGLRAQEQAIAQLPKTVNQALGLQSATISTTPSVTSTTASTSTPPVVNSQGQVTGKIISVTA